MNIDHIVYAVSDLEDGMGDIEALLGVRPVNGGRHPDFGTHNALLSLGPRTYLEIIAPCPGVPAPERGCLFGITSVQNPGIATWALGTNSIRALSSAALGADIDMGAITSGGRETPDGTRLEWQLTDPYAMPFGGAVPFLISWGDTPHPAGSAPRAGELIGFRIEHPDVEKIRKALSALGVDIEINHSDKITLIATIRNDRGIVELK